MARATELKFVPGNYLRQFQHTQKETVVVQLDLSTTGAVLRREKARRHPLPSLILLPPTLLSPLPGCVRCGMLRLLRVASGDAGRRSRRHAANLCSVALRPPPPAPSLGREDDEPPDPLAEGLLRLNERLVRRLFLEMEDAVRQKDAAIGLASEAHRNQKSNDYLNTAMQTAFRNCCELGQGSLAGELYLRHRSARLTRCTPGFAASLLRQMSEGYRFDLRLPPTPPDVWEESDPYRELFSSTDASRRDEEAARRGEAARSAAAEASGCGSLACGVPGGRGGGVRLVGGERGALPQRERRVGRRRRRAARARGAAAAHRLFGGRAAGVAVRRGTLPRGSYLLL